MTKNDFNLLMKNLKIENEQLIAIALGTGFIKRQRLINPLGFLSALCTESVCGIASYNDIAANIDADGGPCVTRQAIYKKVKAPCEDFLKKTLALIITKKISSDVLETIKAKNIYKRILVQDSTIIRLPIKLFPDFSGEWSIESLQCTCTMRI